MLKSYKKKINYFILFLILTSTTHFFNDLYNIYYRKYEERMIRSYNYCGGISYGYIKKVKNTYLKNEKEIHIINYTIHPTSMGLFPDLITDKVEKKNLILLNFPSLTTAELLKYSININHYNLINKENNCYYLKKK